MRFSPSSGQVFSDNKLMHFRSVSSFRTGFFSRCCFPQKPAGRRGRDFGHMPAPDDAPGSLHGVIIRRFITSLALHSPQMHLRRGLSAQALVAACRVIELIVPFHPARFCPIGVVVQIDLLVLHIRHSRSTKTLSSARPRPSMLIRIWPRPVAP